MDIKELSNQIKNCKKCSLCETRQNVVVGRGSLSPQIVFIGEAPGEEEDIQGRPFVGRSGMLLDRAIKENGIENYCILNILKCRPPQNRKPTTEEIKSCENWLKQQLELLNPKLIVCLGSVSLNYFFPNKKITQSKGYTFTDNNGQRFIAFYHPSYVLRGSYSVNDYIKDFDKIRFFLEDGDMEKPKESLVGDPQPSPLNPPIPVGPQPKNPTPLPTGSQSYVPLHVHWERGSVGDVFGTDDERAEDFFQKGFTSAAITDHGSLSSLIYAQTALKKRGVKPILGIECYIDETEKPYQSHLILLVKNQFGYENLLKLHTIAKKNTHKVFNKVYQKLTIDEICTHSDGLICSTACISGTLAKRWLRDEPTDKLINKLKTAFGEDLYLETMPNRIPNQARFNEFLLELSKIYNIKLIITTDSHYNSVSDKKYHDIVKAISFKKTLENKTGDTKWKPPGFSDDTFCNLTTEEITELLRTNHPKLYPIREELFANTIEVANKCDFEIPENLGDTLIGDEQEARQRIQDRIELSLEEYKKFSGHPEQEIDARIDTELKLIFDRGFAKYFDKVLDMCDYADENEIPRGPGRGSVGGSLVAYLLGITKVDPLRFGTLWERFLSPTRTPDIDMDFSGLKRGNIIAHLRAEYGLNNISYIITFNEWQDKGILRDVGRVYEIPLEEINRVTKELTTKTAEGIKIEDALLTSEVVQKFNEKHPEVIEAALKLKGKIRHIGIHAAGVVICDGLQEKIPTEIYDSSESRNSIVTSWEKDALEKLGIIKFDVLGISILDVIDECLKGANLSWTDLPEDYSDPKIFELLKSGKTAGIFQFGSQLITDYLRHLNPDKFNDLVATNALCRPGPLNSGMAMDYVDRKGGKAWDYDHPKLEPIVKDTYGIIAYQEQIMQVANQVGNFSMIDSEKLMKLVAKSKGKDALGEKYNQFLEGALSNGLDKQQFDNLFNKILEFGRYGFNKCLSGDTEIVNIETGSIQTIEKIYETKIYPPVYSLDNNLKLCQGKIKNVYKNGVKSTYEITTRLGKKIKASENHRFLTIDNWKQLKELNVKDRIAVPRQLPIDATGEIPDYYLTILGYALSEGNMCHPAGFYVFSTDPKQLEEYSESLVKFENTKATLGEKGRHGCPSIYAGRINLKQPSGAVEWMRSIGMYYKKATEKEFPSFVYTLNNSKLAFLLAKMWEGDGCLQINKSGFVTNYYATSSLKIATQLQHFLLRLGIISTIHKKNFKYRGGIKIGYTITISGRYNDLIFYNTIGQNLSTKKPAMEKIKILLDSYTTNKNGLLARGSSDLIPYSILPKMQEEVLKTNKSLKDLAGQIKISPRSLWGSKKKVGFRRETIKLIGESINSEYLSNLGNSDIYWDEIVSIEYMGEEKTYDLEMEDNHNFIANDIIVHNSHSIEYSMIGYWTAWLKFYHPLAFYSALINNEGDETNVLKYVKEATDSGVAIKPPSVEYPSEKVTFDLKTNTLYLGLNKVKGIGPEEIKKIIDAGKNFEKIKKVKKNIWETLVSVGYLDSLESNRKQLLEGKELSKNTLWAYAENARQDGDWSEEEKLSRMRKYLTCWPRTTEELPKITHEEYRKSLKCLKEETVDNNAFLSIGWVHEVKTYNNKAGTAYTLGFDDGSSRVILNLSNTMYLRNKKLVDKLLEGTYDKPLIFCLHPYFLGRGTPATRDGKLLILWMGELDMEIPENILRGIKGETEGLEEKQFLITNISYGTSQAGNKYASVECVDSTENIVYGAIMDKSNGGLPSFGAVIKGRWNGAFWRGD